MGRSLDLAGILIVYGSAGSTFVAALTQDLRPFGAVVFLALGVTLGTHLMAVAYCLRFGGRFRDWWLLGVSLAAVVWVPLLPWAFAFRWDGTEASFHATLVALVVLTSMLAAAFQRQGRYVETRREMPELQGERRTLVNDVLEKAGLRVSSVRSVSLGSFNAMVQGMGSCIILVDRRAVDSLSRDEFAALVAHEAGHVRAGGYLPYLGAVAWVLLACNAVTVLGYGDLTGNLFVVPMCIAASTLASQRQELRADAFAARITSPDSVAAMVARVHGDLPGGLARIVNRALLSPFLTHPPLEVRRAALGLGESRHLRCHRWVWGLTLTVFVIAPVNIWVAAEDGVRWANGVRFLSWALPSIYLALWLTTAVSVVWAAKRALHATFGRSGKRAWFRSLTALVGLALLVGVLLEPLLGSPRWLDWLVLGLAPVFLVLLLAALITRSLRTEFERLPRELRRSIRESIAALQEGHPEEGLEILDRVFREHGRQAWFLAQRAACYIYLDRLDEAARDLEAALKMEPRPLYPRLLLGSVELLRGNVERAATITEDLTSHASGDESAWRLRALVALEAGKADEAADLFARARGLKERNAPALAGEVLAALESGAPLDEVDGKLEEARRIEPMDVTVRIAGVRRHLLAGSRAGALEDWAAASRALLEKGHHGFLRYYRGLAARWGLNDNTAER